MSQLAIGLQYQEYLDPTTSAELTQLVSGLQQWGANQGVWQNVAYASSLFWPDAGTWAPKAGDVRLFKWCLVGRKMTVTWWIQPVAATGTIKTLRLRVPNTGYKIQAAPNAAVPTLGSNNFASSSTGTIFENTNYAGIIGVDNSRTDGIVLMVARFDSGNMDNGSTIGCAGTLHFDVQPAA